MRPEREKQTERAIIDRKSANERSIADGYYQAIPITARYRRAWPNEYW